MSGEFGVYVHVPFCARRCDYCAFATWTDRSHLMGDYVDACVAELASVGRAATSVFFGGGTPSLLPAALLVRVLDAVPRAAGAEVTVECNPETVTPELLAAYRAGGVDRLSFGVQSMVPAVLRSLGREHDPLSVERAVRWAREAGFESFNVDLIYGGAGESLDDWRRTLDAVVALGPPHVSAYALTVEPGTALADDPSRHPDDDDQADKYVVAESVLSAAGLRSYEISNWARPGHECRHNLLYWSQGDYRGIGCAAHSHVDGRRWWNVRTPERFIGLVAQGESPVAADEVLGADERKVEGLQLALRTSAGVPAEVLPDDLDGLVGLVEPAAEPGHVRLTVRGRLLANEVAVRLGPG
ncbi:MAG TPA: radical SAM family heme chaperone HemW [Acidimicrobiales bacterium]|nr:radical SAM family heme chaperone HemW [Acidimicrobiales bacterium]